MLMLRTCALVTAGFLSATANAADPSYRLYADAAYSQVDYGSTSSNWKRLSVALNTRIDTETGFTVSVDHEDRSDASDTRFTGEIWHAFAKGREAYIAVTTVPDPDFREKASIRLGGRYTIAPWVSLTGDVRYADYAQGHAVTLEPGIRFHDARETLSLDLKSINTSTGRLRSGWSARAAYRPEGKLGATVGYASYPETEAAGTATMRSAFAMLALPVSDSLAFRLVAEHDKSDFGYTRQGISLGTTVRL